MTNRQNTNNQENLKRSFLNKQLLSYFFLNAVFLIFISHELLPAFQPSLIDSLANESKIFREIKESTQISEGTKNINTIISLTSLVDIYTGVSVYKNDANNNSAYLGDYSTTIRYDKLVLYLGFWVMTLFILFKIPISLTSIVKKNILENNKDTTNETSIMEKTALGETPEEVLEKEIYKAQQRVNDIYERSTLLLVGGIIMAFIGVMIFYTTLPDTNKTDINSYFLNSIRPTGSLIFIEAIAWFLLRQYRVSMEDYKMFYKIYLKRVNYLIGFRALHKEASIETRLIIIMSLLQEDLSGKLQSGETTESIELTKLPDNNPLFSLIQNLIDKIPQKSNGT